MQAFLVLCLVAFAESAVRECVYDDRGLCMSYCEEGTYSYNTGCGPLAPEPTCDQPQPDATEYDICDYSACYCVPPTVRDTATNRCVPLRMCPQKNNVRYWQPSSK